MSPRPTASTSPLRLVSTLPSVNNSTLNPDAPQPPPDQRVQTMMDAMRDHPEQPHTLQSLADLVGLCPHYCGQLFKDKMKQRPLDYLHDLRLAKACDLLVTSFKNVTAIAEAVGFEHVNYFIRVFKAAHGCTPLAYRKRSAGEVVAKKIA